MHITAHRARFVLGVLIVVGCGELHGTAQGLPSLRVMAAEAKVFALPDVISEVVTVTHAGAVVDLIDKRDGWYWVLSGRDQNGSRQLGWIQANQVAIATATASRDSLRTLQEELGALPAPAGPRPKDSKKAEQEDTKKAEQEKARAVAEEARADARIQEAARKVDEARREYEGLTKKPQ